MKTVDMVEVQGQNEGKASARRNCDEGQGRKCASLRVLMS